MLSVGVPFALGADSFFASFGLAPLLSSRRERLALAALLGAADGLATALAASGTAGRGAGVALIAAAAAAAMALFARGRRRLFALLPLLALDNLVTPLSPAQACAAAAASAALALIGMAASQAVTSLVPARLRAGAGCALGLAAFVALWLA